MQCKIHKNQCCGNLVYFLAMYFIDSVIGDACYMFCGAIDKIIRLLIFHGHVCMNVFAVVLVTK